MGKKARTRASLERTAITCIGSSRANLEKCIIANSLIDGKLVLTSVQLALARQDAKERESSDDGGAGRMTATARADIGARFEARLISVGLGLRTDV